MSDRLHEIKIWPVFFESVRRGAKPFELRKMDRDYRVGDYLRLMAYDPVLKSYTGDTLYRRITYVLDGSSKIEGIEPGYCILGIAETNPPRDPYVVQP